MPKRTPTLSQPELCEAIQTNEETLRLWRQDGCPHQLVRNKPRYVLHEVFWWRIEQAKTAALPEDVKAAKNRRILAEARMAEIEVEQAEGRLIAIEAAAQPVEAMLGNLRAQLLPLPQRWAPKVIGLKTIPEVTQVLEQAVYEAMTALSGEAR